jgi:hypothetical protein
MSSFRYVTTILTQANSQTLDTAVRDRDAESLEHIVVSMFDFHLDYQQAPQLRGVRDEYVSMAKSSLATKQVSHTCQIHMWELIIDLFGCAFHPIPYSYPPPDANRGGDEGNPMPIAGHDRTSHIWNQGQH